MVMGVPRPKGNCLAMTEGMPPPVSKYLYKLSIEQV
jgi:hypothetical protein